VRYDPQKLHSVFGEGLALLEAVEKVHVTPGGREQWFLEARFQRRD
jgi:hypothetical protein